MRRVTRAGFADASCTRRHGIPIALVLAALSMFGCGGGTATSTEGSTTASTTGSDEPGKAKPSAAVNRKESEPGSGIARDQPHPQSESAGKDAVSDTETPSRSNDEAREVGRTACEGMTPLEAAARYEVRARAAGVGREFARYVAHPPASVERSNGYPRLVAALYASTLPGGDRGAAAAGCTEELVRSK